MFRVGWISAPRCICLTKRRSDEGRGCAHVRTPRESRPRRGRRWGSRSPFSVRVAMRSYTCHLSRFASSNSFGLSAAKKRQTAALDVSPLTARVYDPLDGASEEAIARPRQQRTRATAVPRLRRQVLCVPSRHQCERRECGEKGKLKNKSVRKNRGPVDGETEESIWNLAWPKKT